MADVRKADKEPKNWFRSSRYFRDSSQWYFNTREGTMEGPFELMEDAEARLAEYIRVMTSGFIPPDSELELEPPCGLELVPKSN